MPDKKQIISFRVKAGRVTRLKISEKWENVPRRLRLALHVALNKSWPISDNDTLTIDTDSGIAVLSKPIADHHNWPRFWSLLQYGLPKSARARVFTPAVEDLKADYFESFADFRSFWPRLFLRLFFVLRTIVLVIDCWRAIGIDKVLGFAARFVPDRVKRWWGA